MRPLYCLDTSARQARLAMRTLARSKPAYLCATAILALGIGMSVAMFSLVDAVLLRPLPFPRQESIQVVIRGSQSVGDLAALVRRTLGAMDSNQTIAGVATIGELIDANSARHRFNMILLLWFGVRRRFWRAAASTV